MYIQNGCKETIQSMMLFISDVFIHFFDKWLQAIAVSVFI